MDLISRRRILSFTPVLSGTNVINLNKDGSQMVLRAGIYRYDLTLIDADTIGNVDIIEGLFIITDDVSVIIPEE